VFAAIVLGLFALDRDENARPSKALWIPVVWVSLAGSRTVSQWLQLAAPMESSVQALEGNPLDRNILVGLMAIGVVVRMGRRRGRDSALRRRHNGQEHARGHLPGLRTWMRVASHRGLPEPRECPQDWAAHRSGRPSGNGVVALLEGRFDDLAGMFRAGGGLDWGDELSRVSEEARGRASPGSV